MCLANFAAGKAVKKLIVRGPFDHPDEFQTCGHAQGVNRLPLRHFIRSASRRPMSGYSTNRLALVTRQHLSPVRQMPVCCIILSRCFDPHRQPKKPKPAGISQINLKYNQIIHGGTSFDSTIFSKHPTLSKNCRRHLYDLHFLIGNSRPSKMVPQMGMSFSCSTGSSNGACSRMVKSAFLPARMLPISSSSPRI
jgi:hypothetical protein